MNPLDLLLVVLVLAVAAIYLVRRWRRELAAKQQSACGCSKVGCSVKTAVRSVSRKG